MGSGASQNNYFMFAQYKDYNDEKFLKSNVEVVFLRKKELYGVFQHSDVFFYTPKECLIVCFHKGKSRVALIRQTKAYCLSLEIYEETKVFKISFPITIRDVLKAVLPIAKSEYCVVTNNCNDNAQELIERLYLKNA